MGVVESITKRNGISVDFEDLKQQTSELFVEVIQNELKKVESDPEVVHFKNAYCDTEIYIQLDFGVIIYNFNNFDKTITRQILSLPDIKFMMNLFK